MITFMRGFWHAHILPRRYTLAVLLILLVAAYFRLHDLSTSPPGVNQDEAITGYDAYAYAYTGLDHHGNPPWPMLESFEDWSSPMATYLLVPFVRIFGLSTLSTRVPIALLSIASVGIFYLLIRNLSKNRKLALLGALLLAITPWSITTARWAVPPHTVAIFMIAALYTAERAYSAMLAKRNSLALWIVTGVLAGLLVYTYPTMKVYVPLMLICIGAVFLWKRWKECWALALSFTAVFLPLVVMNLLDYERYNLRFASVSIASLDNPPLAFVIRYLSYLTPVFYSGSLDRNFGAQVPGPGSIYFILLPFFYVGLVSSLLSLRKKPVAYLVFPVVWHRFLAVLFLVSPIPPSLTADQLTTHRGLQLLILAAIFTVSGLYATAKYIIHKRMPLLGQAILAVCCSLAVGLGLSSYLTSYEQNINNGYGRLWFYQRAPLATQYAVANQDKYQKIVFDNFNQDYIYFLFYSQFDPKKLDYSQINQHVDPKSAGYLYVSQVGKFHFQSLSNIVPAAGQPVVNLGPEGAGYMAFEGPDNTLYLKFR